MQKKQNPKTQVALTQAQINAISNRHANMLKKHSPLVQTSLGTYTGSAGGQVRVRLRNVGYITRLFAKVTINTTIATATATLSPKGLYAALTKIRLTDFANNERINCTGFNLFMRNSLRNQKSGLAGMSYLASNNSVSQDVEGVNSGFTNPNTVLTAGTTNQTLVLEIPVCKGNGDLRGMIDANTIEGESWLTFDLASTLYGNGDDDKVFNGAATTTVAFNSASIEVIQEHYLPQQVGGVYPHPLRDFKHVYELSGIVRSSADLASGTDKLIPMMNNRDIRGFYLSYLNNGVLGGSSGNELSRFKYVVGGSNYMLDVPEWQQQFIQLEKMGITMPKGCYFFDFPQGIETQNFGVSQIAVTPGGTVTAGASLEWMFESLYRIGQPLSSLVQS